MTVRNPKAYDCLAAKEAAQREIVARMAGLSPEQQLALVRKEVEEGPLGDWWRSLPKDAGPVPESSANGGSGSRGA